MFVRAIERSRIGEKSCTRSSHLALQNDHFVFDCCCSVHVRIVAASTFLQIIMAAQWTCWPTDCGECAIDHQSAQ